MFIAQKGPGIEEELKTAEKKIKKLNGKIKEVKILTLSNMDKRSLVAINRT